MGGGHDHYGDHYGEPLPLPKSVTRHVWWVLGVVVGLTVLGMVLLWPKAETPSLGSANYVTGTVDEITECRPSAPDCQVIVVTVTDGEFAGETTEINMLRGEGAPMFDIGSDVWLNADSATGQTTFGFVDIKRDQPLIFLAMLFSAAVVLLSRWKGVAALAGLVVSILILTFFILPALLLGSPPVAVAAVGAAAIAIASMGLAHGFTMRTGVALVGTVIALFLTAVLGSIFTAAASFTGIGGEDAFYLQNSSLDLSIDFRGLFLAGLVIGALGVLDDVTVTQAATVWEVRRADPATPLRKLYAAGMRVGRDHVAATVNTLVLAYIGASLPLFLILVMSEAPIAQSLTNELIAQEVVRSLVGGLGIVAAVPITTFLAAWLLTRVDHEPQQSTGALTASPESA